MNCRPVSQTNQWPSRDQVRSLLLAQLGRAQELLASASVRRLAETASPARGTGSIAERIIHGFHDEAKHSGEMYLILKICRASA